MITECLLFSTIGRADILRFNQSSVRFVSGDSPLWRHLSFKKGDK